MPPKFTVEDFAAWRENPISKAVFDALDRVSALQQQHWIETSWGQGVCPPELLLELRTRADAYRSLSELSYERLCEVLGETKEA